MKLRKRIETKPVTIRVPIDVAGRLDFLARRIEDAGYVLDIPALLAAEATNLADRLQKECDRLGLPMAEAARDE